MKNIHAVLVDVKQRNSRKFYIRVEIAMVISCLLLLHSIYYIYIIYIHLKYIIILVNYSIFFI